MMSNTNQYKKVTLIAKLLRNAGFRVRVMALCMLAVYSARNISN